MFLDEVGDMPLATQIKLLRVLENGEITRVGSNHPIKVNVRILSATNRNLEEAIAAGTFRSDLYHRLKVVTIRLPTLRAAEPGHPDPDRLFHQAVLRAARQADQGHVARRAAKAVGLRLAGQRPPASQRGREHGGGRLRRPAGPRRFARGAGWPAGSPRRAGRPLRWRRLVGKPLAEIERLFVTETLRLAGGNREEAAKMLGIGERTLYRKIREYGL